MDSRGITHTLTNTDIVNHAIKAMLVPLQDFIIQKMELEFGDRWWDEVYDCRFRINASRDIPHGEDVTLDAVRSFMDMTLCTNILTHYNLVPRVQGKDAKDPVGALRRVRNFQSHDGRIDIDDTEAMSMIASLMTVDDLLFLGSGDELRRLMSLVLMPEGQRVMRPVEIPEKEQASKQPKDDPRDRRPAREEHDNDNRPSTELRKAPLPVTSEKKEGRVTSDIPGICITSCIDMHETLKELQKDGKSSAARSVVNVDGIRKTDRGYRLKLHTPTVVDDTLGLLVAGREFDSTKVSFDDYNRSARTIDISTEDPDLLCMLDGPDIDYMDVQVYTDLVWLIDRTRDFYIDYRYRLRDPYVRRHPGREMGPTFLELSDEQQAAVEMSLSSPLSYVWGVPGSGKTQYVLSTAITECIDRGMRVAVIAPTNLALEQVLRGLIGSFKDIPENRRIIDPENDIIRVGTPTSEFLADFAYVCDRKDIQRKYEEGCEDLAFALETRFERKYDGYRELCDEAVCTAEKMGRNDRNGRRNLVRKLQPLVKLMSEDPRGLFEDADVDESTVLEDTERIRDALFTRDRSKYKDGKYGELDDDELNDAIEELEERVEGLRMQSSHTDLSKAKIVAMTLSKFIASFGPDSAGGRHTLDVDHVFVDEAGYSNCIQAYTLMSLGVPVTLLGDHMQLDPVCEVSGDRLVSDMKRGEDGRYGFLWNMSAPYMEHLQDGTVGRLEEMYLGSEGPDFIRMEHRELTTTHRFGQNMADVLGRYVYTLSGINSATDRPLEVVVIDAHVDSFPYDDRRDKSIRSNQAEADAVAEYVKTIRGEDFVVLTPYRDQMRTLRSIRGLKEHVLTIHSAQGREWETVIVSVCDCRANDEDTLLRFTSIVDVPGEDIKGLKVMNTALSRAKKRLVIICDKEFWSERRNELIGDLVRNIG